MSTLADLQRRNLAKMEASSSPEPEAPPPDATPSNEVSIIPSLAQSIETLNDEVNERPITPLIAHAVKPSKARMSKASPKASKPGAADKALMPEMAEAHDGEGDTEAAGQRIKNALDAQLRAHLMEQLMPAGGKGPVTRLNVEMPEDLHQRLKQHCVRTRTPIKALINALIALYLEDKEAA